MSKEAARIRTKIEEAVKAQPAEGGQVLRMLRLLEKDALATGDEALIGFLYFHQARSHYLRDEHAAFYGCMQKTFAHLLLSGDKVMLARVCNLFGAQANNAGCFDIAYNYYRMALSLAKDEEDELIGALIHVNLGDLLAETGDFRGACTYIRKGLPVIEAHKEDAMHRGNVVTATLDLALYSIYLDRVQTADRLVARLLRRGFLSPGQDDENAFWYLIYRAWHALKKREEKTLLLLAHEIASGAESYPLFSEMIEDVVRLCRVMLAEGALKPAAVLIAAMEKADVTTATLFRRQQLTQLMVEYHTGTGNKRELLRYYEERQLLTRGQLEAQKEVHRRSVRQLLEMKRIREEQQMLRRENLSLQEVAETDALCGVPNRYALARVLEQALELAGREGTRLGVGIADVDAFKRYNDTYGHGRGDRCLQEVAQALQEAAKPYGIFVARYGGDEFVMVYENMTDGEIRGFEKEFAARAPVPVTHGFFNAVPGKTLRQWDYLTRADTVLYGKKKKR